MGLVIDMNERERERIARDLRALTTHASDAADLLEAPRTTEDWDDKLVTQTILLALDARPVRELMRIVEDSRNTEIPDTPGDLL